MNDHQGKRLLRLRGDTLLVISGFYRITFGPDGRLVEHRLQPEEGACRSLTIPAAGDEYAECRTTSGDVVPGPWVRESTIVRIGQDQVDSIGPFFLSDGWRSHSEVIRSPLGPRGTLRFARSEPTLLYARDDEYRIELWDLLSGSPSMVVRRQSPRWARTEVDIVLDTWGFNEQLAPGDVGMPAGDEEADPVERRHVRPLPEQGHPDNAGNDRRHKTNGKGRVQEQRRDRRNEAVADVDGEPRVLRSV